MGRTPAVSFAGSNATADGAASLRVSTTHSSALSRLDAESSGASCGSWTLLALIAGSAGSCIEYNGMAQTIREPCIMSKRTIIARNIVRKMIPVRKRASLARESKGDSERRAH